MARGDGAGVWRKQPDRLVSVARTGAGRGADAGVVPRAAACSRRHDVVAGRAAPAAACRGRRRVAWTILRPTLVYGAARDKSLTPLARRATRWRVFGLPAGSGLRQPVHAADISAEVLRALDGGARGRVLQIGGGERLTASAMFERVRASL